MFQVSLDFWNYYLKLFTFSLTYECFPRLLSTRQGGGLSLFTMPKNFLGSHAHLRNLTTIKYSPNINDSTWSLAFSQMETRTIFTVIVSRCQNVLPSPVYGCGPLFGVGCSEGWQVDLNRQNSTDFDICILNIRPELNKNVVISQVRYHLYLVLIIILCMEPVVALSWKWLQFEAVFPLEL